MLYVTGDLHGDFSPLINFANSKEGRHLQKTDHVIVLGDFGIWPETVGAVRELDGKLNFTLLFIEGNHDHPTVLESFPKQRLFGGEVHNIGGVYHLCRSGIYSVPTENGDIRIAVCGGGDSKDKEKRTDGVDWFEEEAVTEADVQKLLERAAAHRMEVDYFLSHALSSAVKSEWNYECARCAWGNGGSFEPSESDYRIRDLIGRIRARTYFSAHEHIDREFLLDGKRYRSVYRDFVRL